MKTAQNASPSPHLGKVLPFLFKYLGAKIAHLFEPEEVEIIFDDNGTKIGYTYTKVTHKNVA